MTQSARTRLESYIARLESDGSRLTIDADTHISDPDSSAFNRRPSGLLSPDDYFHGKPISAEDLIKSMDAAEINMSLVWQNPAVTDYVGDPDADYNTLFAANRYIAESADRYPDRLLPAGWTDPRALGVDGAIRLAEFCVNEFGFPIVKINPAQNGFPIDSEHVLTVVDGIVGLGAVPAFHFGADTEFTPASGLRVVAERIAPNPIIAVHMGGGGAGYVQAEETYHAARRLGLELDNIVYIESAKRETHIETDYLTYEAKGARANTRICCASDAPYGLQIWNFAGHRALLAQHFTSDVAQKYLGGNAARCYASACRSVLR
ncbi:MAG: hypothetical protein EA426_18825 [Spirochaetaceae bacterium]|nr:MAG: hypothetical protein EA426_18825 [Spirochaetaceae bacterium]